MRQLQIPQALPPSLKPSKSIAQMAQVLRERNLEFGENGENGVEASDRANSTKARYATIVNTFVHGGLAQLRVRELTVPAVDRFLRAIRANHGAATAKGCRTVLSGMVGLALRHGAIVTDPVTDAGRIRGSERK